MTALAHSSKPSGKGGARKGAGRPPGAASKKTQAIAAQAMDQGVSPIEVMLANMRYYHERAESFDHNLTELAEQMTPERIKAGGAETIQLLQLVAKVGEFRMKAQECAVDAAPYVHPRLAALAMKVSTGDSKKAPAEITQQMTAKVAAESYAQLLAGDD